MNIKNRLQKLEKQANLSDGFCLCFHNYFEAAINSVYDGLPFIGAELPETDFCLKCRKPVNPQNRRTISQLIEIYGY